MPNGAQMVDASEPKDYADSQGRQLGIIGLKVKSREFGISPCSGLLARSRATRHAAGLAPSMSCPDQFLRLTCSSCTAPARRIGNFIARPQLAHQVRTEENPTTLLGPIKCSVGLHTETFLFRRSFLSRQSCLLQNKPLNDDL